MLFVRKQKCWTSKQSLFSYGQGCFAHVCACFYNISQPFAIFCRQSSSMCIIKEIINFLRHLSFSALANKLHLMAVEEMRVVWSEYVYVGAM